MSSADDHDRRSDAVLALVGGELDRPVRRVADLGGSGRSRVVRALAGDQSIVIKTYADAGPGFAREAAGLAALSEITERGSIDIGAPRLLAVITEPPTVVMTDLGAGDDDLAHRFLGTDSGPAADGLMGWAGALGRVHAAGYGLGERFAALLDRYGAGDIPTDEVPGMIDHTVERLPAALALLDLQPPSEVLAVLSGLPELLSAHAGVLTPGDACPDNNLIVDGSVRLLDFESACFRHPAWDLAYLTVPWATCWCSWAVPEPLINGALAAWRAAAGPAGIDEQVLQQDLRIAELGWGYASMVHRLPPVVTGEDWTSGTPSKPDLGATLQHRLDRITRQSTTIGHPELSPLINFAGTVQERLRAAVGVQRLASAPAFRAIG